MLTDRQRRTYQFIDEYHDRHGFAPKLGEIAEGIGIRSKGVVHRYIKAIAEEGLIELRPGRHRGIRLIKDHHHDEGKSLELPLAGKIAAGHPIEAIPDQDTLNLAEFFIGPSRFVLKVQGDSMIEAGILDGDMVIVEKRDYADDGDIVVALIDNDEATLKYLKQNRDGNITLIPANKTMQPMSYPAEQVQIQGVVVGQMRSYKARKQLQIMNRE
jgi:repressor LexA